MFNMPNTEKKSNNILRGNYLLPIVAGVLAVAALAAATKLIFFSGGKASNVIQSSQVSSSKNTNSIFATSSSLSQTTSFLGSSSKSSSSKSSSNSSSSKLTSSSKTGSAIPGSSQASTINDSSLDNTAYFQNAVFIGDSITQGIKQYKIYKSPQILTANNFSVNHTSITVNGTTVLASDAAAALKPKKVFVLMGVNDIIWMTSTKTFTNYYSKLIDQLKTKCPDATIYVQSVFPVTSTEEARQPKLDNSNIDSFNKALQQMCTTENVKYLDVASVLKGSDGRLSVDDSTDGINIKPSEYYKWLNYISKF
jgi:lysophospholipase L1-like esterase